MKCPKCNEEMWPFGYRDVEVDRCFKCNGIWLDKDELEAVFEHQLGRVFDTAAFSREPSPMDQVPGHCHTCQQAMITLSGAADIRFEWCERCEGIFLDQGELATLEKFEPE